MTDLFSRTADCAIMQYPRAPWTRQIPLLGLFAFINLLSISSLSAADGAKSPDDADSIATKWKTQGWPLIETFCIDCHNEDFQEAELDLSAFNSIDGLKQDESVVRKVLNMIAFGAMPPEDYDLPTDAQRNLLERVLDETHYAITCNHGPVAGRVTARRLNRTEYNNSVRDLFGMDLHPADGFPSDEVGGGFDNNADVLSLSPLQIEKYFDAAESVASQVIYDVSQFERSDLQRSTDQFVVVGNSDTGSFNGRFLDAQSWAWTEIDVKHEGKYRLVVRAGSSVKKDERDDLAVFGPDDVLVDVLSFKYYGGSGSSDSESFSMNLDRGTQRFSFVPAAALAILTGADKISDLELKVGETTFSLADHFTEDTIRAGRELVGKPLKPGRVDNEKFPFMIRRLDASGPSEPPERLFPPAHRRIFHDYPQWGAKKDHDVIRAAVKCLQPLMRRAFRENVSEDEAKAYADLVLQSVKRDESFHRGMQNAIAGILVSPRFLFRIETPPSDWKPEPESLVPGIDLTNNGAKIYDVPLTQHQLATRLSYFLWSSTPDDKLLGAADAGELHGDAVMDHVRRMLDDPKSRTLSQEFAGQWFGLRNLIGFEPDEASLDGFQSELLPMMTRETELLFEHMVGENRPSVELITADYSFLNADLANHYGIDFSSDRETKPDAFRKVSLGDTPRRGLLGHASVLTLTSEPNRTSPVKRGKWILENILGTAPPEPPANVPELDDAEGDTTHLSLRRQLEIHRESPACSACHSVMDQLGFGLENFDAVGRFRLKDGNIEIDSSGELPGGRSFAGATQLSEVLGKTEQQAFAKVVAERLLGFALGRELGPSDRCSVDEIVAATEADGYRISDIISQVIQSRPFRYYQWTVGGEK